ncbi:alcohol dehydrogenase GroES-like domain-containing protein [Hypoxylon sp. FL1857]|nr:alcohol dehydrogenase GroES-like domain-containing protein [Hypoxylon sp. FL1857]
MRTRKALVGAGAGKYEFVANVEMPELKADTLLCKVFAIALNPVDAKAADFSATPGSVGGFDFSGEVVEVGTEVKRFKIGDRVFASSFGLNPDDKSSGAFSEYSLTLEDLACHIPDSIAFEAAATLGLSVGTAGCAISRYLGLPLLQNSNPEMTYVLVSGGASASGSMAIQFLRMSGFRPIATCSPGNTKRLKSIGAIETFDYHSSRCGLEIRTYTENRLAFVLDCIATTETMRMCYDAIGSAGGKYVTLNPPSTIVKYTRRDISVKHFVGHTMFGVPVRLSGIHARRATMLDRQCVAWLLLQVEGLLKDNFLHLPPFQIRQGGLNAIQYGIEDLRVGNTTGGVKLVYSLP